MSTFRANTKVATYVLSARKSLHKKEGCYITKRQSMNLLRNTHVPIVSLLGGHTTFMITLTTWHKNMGRVRRLPTNVRSVGESLKTTVLSWNTRRSSCLPRRKLILVQIHAVLENLKQLLWQQCISRSIMHASQKDTNVLNVAGGWHQNQECTATGSCIVPKTNTREGSWIDCLVWVLLPIQYYVVPKFLSSITLKLVCMYVCMFVFPQVKAEEEENLRRLQERMKAREEKKEKEMTEKCKKVVKSPPGRRLVLSKDIQNSCSIKVSSTQRETIHSKIGK